MTKPLSNRFIRVAQQPGAERAGTATMIPGRKCHRCQQPKSTGGGRVRWSFQNNLRISLFTCAGCLA